MVRTQRSESTFAYRYTPECGSSSARWMDSRSRFGSDRPCRQHSVIHSDVLWTERTPPSLDGSRNNTSQIVTPIPNHGGSPFVPSSTRIHPRHGSAFQPILPESNAHRIPSWLSGTAHIMDSRPQNALRHDQSTIPPYRSGERYAASGIPTTVSFHGLRLRGAEETWRAIQRDRYNPCSCSHCETTICAILDAAYVLCPLCHEVSPFLEGDAATQHGLGLGFTLDQLAQFQAEIVSFRS